MQVSKTRRVFFRLLSLKQEESETHLTQLALRHTDVLWYNS